MSGKKSKKAKKAKKDRKKEAKARKAKPAPKPVAKPAAKAGAAAARTPAAKPAAGSPAQAAAPPAKAGKGTSGRKSRRSSLSQRRGPHGELLAPGDLLLPGGPKGPEEVQYLFRGTVAAEHPAGEDGVGEVITKRGEGAEADRGDLTRHMRAVLERFEKGSIEPLLPNRPARRGTFQGVVERARQRRREIGAFLRGLDIGRTETSHMDSHGEASLQSLMEWAARLENLVEADEPDQADYNQFHRGLDQLENTTEALIIDVEQTLRRLRDRVRTR
jgi:hypothetical protein